MDSFAGRLAVVTGGGTGMGRELVIQLAADGCSVATCDVNVDQMEETARRAEKDAPADVRITTHAADVSDEAHMMRFRDEVVAQHETDHVDLLFNNAGIGGGNSFLTGPREAWDKTFAVCWGGVYNGMRAFADLVVASDDAYVVNTSSVNGFWASLGPGVPHTAYSAAKFAVKGFSEALMQMARRGLATDGMSDEDIQNLMKLFGEMFRDNAPLSAEQAATIILDGVRAGKWRILVGDDAHALDEAVRADPEDVYGEHGLNLDTIIDS